MRLKSLGVLIAAALTTALSASGNATGLESDALSTPSAVTLAQSETPQRWFIQFESAPKAKGGADTKLASERSAFRNAALSEGIPYREGRNFQTLFNGLTVEAKATDAAKLSQLPGVKAVFPVVNFDAPEPAVRGAQPSVFNSITLTKVDQARASLGLTGKNIKVGIIDTGIDIDHPDLGGTGVPGTTPFPSARVITGYDFVGDNYNSSGTPQQQVPVPDPNPDDCAGHGTHVAGIVGAKAGTATGITGVAPDVKFGAYRIFGCEGTSSADVIVAALERAYLDGMDVVNMSLGSSYQWPQYPTALVSDALVDAGVVVVASAGNNGANGVYSLGAPGVGEKVIGVASYDNTKTGVNKALINGATPFGYATLTFAPSPPTSGTSAEVVYVGRGCVDNDTNVPGNQTDPYLADPAGKVALITRGVCSFGEKYFRARDAGAVGVIIENSSPGIFFGTLGSASGTMIFGISVSQATGTALKTAAKPTTITWTADSIEEVLPTAGLISSFSSFGLSPDLTAKPDVGAPGGFITSTYPLEQGGYAVLSGTSMSSPHTAGAVAMLLEKNHAIAAGDMRSVLQNSAEPKRYSLSFPANYLDNVHRQGAGMIDVAKSATATTLITPSKLTLGESTAGPQTRTVTIRNSGPSAVTYSLSHAPALSTGPASAAGNGTYTPSFYTGYAGVAFSSPTVTVPAGGTASVDVTITANATLFDRSQYGGYIVLTPQGGGAVYRVPYAGFKGDYQSIQVLVPTAYGFPWLAKADAAGNLTKQNAGAEFTMKNGDIAYVVAHFDHPSQLVTIDIVPLRQVGGARDLNVYTLPYWSRNSAPTTFFAFDWDGSAKVNGRRTPLPMGDYKLKLTVLKALGDPANPSHYETWESPAFKINRSSN